MKETEAYLLRIHWLLWLCWLMFRVMWLTLILRPCAACCEYIFLIRLILAFMLLVISWCCERYWRVNSLWIFSLIFNNTFERFTEANVWFLLLFKRCWGTLLGLKHATSGDLRWGFSHVASCDPKWYVPPSIKNGFLVFPSFYDNFF